MYQRKRKKQFLGAAMLIAHLRAISVFIIALVEKKFTMNSGERDKISGVVPDKEQYCMCLPVRVLSACPLKNSGHHNTENMNYH